MNRDVYVSRAEAAFLINVATSTIAKWRARGWVDRFGAHRELRTRSQPNGRLLYRVGDLLDAESDTWSSGKGHRAAAA